MADDADVWCKLLCFNVKMFNYIRMGINIFKISIWGVIVSVSWLEIMSL